VCTDACDGLPTAVGALPAADAGRGRASAANKVPWILHRHDAVLTLVAAHVCREHDFRDGSLPVDVTMRCGHAAVCRVTPGSSAARTQRPPNWGCGAAE